MKFAPQPDRERALGLSGSPLSLDDGVLPPRPEAVSAEPQGMIAPDGSLCVGLFKIPTESLSARLRDMGRLTDRIPRTFPTIADLQRALVDDNIRVPPGSVDFPSAFATFKRAMDGQIRGSRFTDTARLIDRLSVGQELSPSDLGGLRAVLVDAAYVATVCAGIDQSHFEAVTHRSRLQRGKDWLVDKVGTTRLRDPRIRGRLTPMPFEDFNPMAIRVDADVWAQRLALAEDGSTVVRTVCAAEHYVAEVLAKGSLRRSVRSRHGGLEGAFVVLSQDGRRKFFSLERKVSDVFAALQLGRSASECIMRLESAHVDLVRMCKFVDRDSALGVQGNLVRLSPQVHARLNYVDEWAGRFDGSDGGEFSDEERHDLAGLLLDAEICLYIAGHVQNVVRGDRQRAFWRRLWSASVCDREVSCGIDLANNLPSPLSHECLNAAEVVTNAALLLGFSGEDRGVGPAWRVPENPLASLTWAMNRL